MSLVAHMTKGAVDEKALEAALLSANPRIRIMARGAASQWVEGFALWVTEEMNRPTADPSAVLSASWTLLIQSYASIAAQVLDPAGDKMLMECLQETLADMVPVHMAQVREAANG